MADGECRLEEGVLGPAGSLEADPVFERSWWIYSLCRERLFADHTEAIAAALDPLLRAQGNPRLLEVGCGPGYYSRRLAARFPALQATGVDTSERLLSYARHRAGRSQLQNCRFLRADAQDLSDRHDSADAAIASRLFLILADRDRVLRAIFMALRPGGMFFVAEPTSPLRTAFPLWLMRGYERMTGRPAAETQPVRCSVLSHGEFRGLLGGQPWSKVEIWHDRRYQYALCEKAS